MRKHRPATNEFHSFYITTLCRPCTQINKCHLFKCILFFTLSYEVDLLANKLNHSQCPFQRVSDVPLCRLVSVFDSTDLGPGRVLSCIYSLLATIKSTLKKCLWSLVIYNLSNIFFTSSFKLC